LPERDPTAHLFDHRCWHVSTAPARPDYSWIDLPVVDPDGRLRHRRGVTEVPGLYFLGLTWQHTRGSALLGWVKDDAEFIADRIEQVRSELVPQHRMQGEAV